MSNVTKPIALDESINTTENTPRNIADVLADELSNIADKIQGGGSGGSGGHIIQNASGANLTQRNTMQFVDSHVTDDSANEKTVIENIKSVTEVQFESATEDGLYDVDVEGAEIGEISEDYVEVTADGVKTNSQLLSDLFNHPKLDLTKITPNSTLVIAGEVLHILYAEATQMSFGSNGGANGSRLVDQVAFLKSSGSTYEKWLTESDGTSTYTSYSSGIAPNGRKYTLYYGNDKAVVDLQTTANRCLMPDGTTNVAQAISKLTVSTRQVTFTTNSVGAFEISSDATEFCLGLMFNVGDEYTYYQYNNRSFILFDMAGNKKLNTTVTARAIITHI